MSTNKIFENHLNIIHTDTEHKHQHSESIRVFGFWIYLMSDCILFAALFSTYAVLSNGIADGPTGKEIFKLPFILIETFFLLFSSITYSLATLAMNQAKLNQVNAWLSLTFLFGLIFVCMELYEFQYLIVEGYGPDRSAFLSGFFTILGTHGLHVACGLIWILVMIIQLFYHGLTIMNQTRLRCLGLFWHFLDVVWICLFTIVYLIGFL
ncbi:cytochrome o ubiquinol oxidase subunit III [Candidatus Curculioniphilus buchneri]|uniref:cytochrome o ubiquinol oxidase subunit III n=1 Tax=Candidatus Curculioniphilus buchneri TaxID=690594 RepID=UPI00376F378A